MSPAPHSLHTSLSTRSLVHSRSTMAATTTATTTMPVPASPVVLPPTGKARVKSVLSGDTAILLGVAKSPDQAPPEVLFTLEGVNAPRYVCVSCVCVCM